jgi:PAS domain S-box-containing protein
MQESDGWANGVTERDVIDALPRAIIVTTPDAEIVLWNRVAEELYGWRADEVLGKTVFEVLVPDDAMALGREIREAVANGGSWTGDFVVRHRSGQRLHIWLTDQPILDATGSVVAVVAASEDVTETRLLEQRAHDLAVQRDELMAEALEAAKQERLQRERLEFVGRINDALASALTRQEIMVSVTQASVPRLGDWCSMYVLPDPLVNVPEVEVAHVDPSMVTYARELQERFPYDPGAATGIAHVIRAGEPEFYPDISEAVMAELDADEEAKEIVRGLALRSAIAVPLIKHGRVLGAMQFVMSASSRRYTEDDLALAQAVASRIAASLENVRLAQHQRVIASTLQASLLPTELPHIPGVEIAVRYWAAGEGTDVGGDFYDAFAVDDGRWAVVIGDVCGTGPAAAAVTGLARHTIAAHASIGAAPEDVLRHLNDVMVLRRTGSFCTVAYSVLQPTASGCTLTLACGGHPLPLIVKANGSVDTIGRPGTLIGMLDTIKVNPVTVDLAPGDSVIFYTDGVTDVPPPHMVEPDDLRAMVGRAAAGAASADALATGLERELSAILPILERSDDIAMLVLRVAEPSSTPIERNPLWPRR